MYSVRTEQTTIVRLAGDLTIASKRCILVFFLTWLSLTQGHNFGAPMLKLFKVWKTSLLTIPPCWCVFPNRKSAGEIIFFYWMFQELLIFWLTNRLKKTSALKICSSDRKTANLFWAIVSPDQKINYCIRIMSIECTYHQNVHFFFLQPKDQEILLFYQY